MGMKSKRKGKDGIPRGFADEERGGEGRLVWEIRWRGILIFLEGGGRTSCGGVMIGNALNVSNYGGL